MARSKRIDDAVERLVGAFISEPEEIMKAIQELVSVLANEIVGSFTPYSDLEVPFILYALRYTQESLLAQHPEAGPIADETAKAFSCIVIQVPRQMERGEE